MGTLRTITLLFCTLALTIAGAETATRDDVKSGEFTTADSDVRASDWYEGTVVSIDPKAGAITIRGARMPYASAYSHMLIEIAEKTRNLLGQAKTDAQAVIRKQWSDRLQAARNEQPMRDDHVFTVPDGEGRVAFLEEEEARNMAFLDADRNITRPEGPRETAVSTSAGTFRTIRDVKLGDLVMIGTAPNADTKSTAAVVIREQIPALPQEHATRVTEKVSEKTTEAVETSESTLKQTGNTIEHGLGKGASKIKHFFTGHHDSED